MYPVVFFVPFMTDGFLRPYKYLISVNVSILFLNSFNSWGEENSDLIIKGG